MKVTISVRINKMNN